jgi:hypothetical protein
VPDAPTDIKAVANPDGTVEVTWTAANGQGHKIVKYEVTAISSGAGAPAGANNGETRLVIPDKDLTYGTQYAFTVVAINDIGGASKASSPVSAASCPTTNPGPGQEPARPDRHHGKGFRARHVGRRRRQRPARSPPTR